MELNLPKNTFFRRHPILTLALSTLLVIGIATGVTLTVLYNAVFVVTKESKPDRVSEGIVPTDEDLENSPHYSHIMIFGVDGAGGNFDKIDTPNFDRIFSKGSINLNGVSEYPTISAENWGSMFMGVTPQKHQITNEKASIFLKIFDNYPTFFKIHAEQDRSATFYSAVNWIPINIGLIEPFIHGMDKDSCYFGTPGERSDANVDRTVKEHIVERVKHQADTIVFAHFDNVDEAGHAGGPTSPKYAEALQTIDGYMGEIYDAYVESGLEKDTLFICVSDHGHKDGGGHGGEDPKEKQTTLAVYGGKNDIIQGSSGKFVSHDLASIVLYALGDKQPAHFEGGVPKNLFSSLPGNN